ncbi:uncharacterized protein LAESUDRAFT_711954 [Laetiporus sulphureus 93-53]|uniref:DUF6533 domain-containing protein n=1 Tax=Laetiporus sulphureus 93-53 TaxID=1314785 RepID=A0A165GCU5_9APHY|nr:uncharacterized protein LAESUDRAFT_711954 [Laetiporus sulphureus 93-53]KZT10172.1 hypothetical protein LAESUDRAFT_711954 [Laetiporus sulphureus 93-53]
MACYDYAVTFLREVRLVWRSDMSIAEANFLVNRYALLLWVTVQSLIFFPPFKPTEKVVLAIVFSADRVFAVSARDWRPTTVAIMLGIIPFIANLSITRRRALTYARTTYTVVQLLQDYLMRSTTSKLPSYAARPPLSDYASEWSSSRALVL